MIKVWVHGSNGRMGMEISQLLQGNTGAKVVGGSGLDLLKTDHQEVHKYSPVDLAKQLAAADVVIDFSSPSGNKTLLEASLLLKQPQAYVIGTTGLTKTQRDQWKLLCKEGQHRLIFAPNTSLGILLTMQLSQKMAKALHPQGFDIEIIESHHKHKLDSPSGTAKFLADRICDVVPLHVVTHRDGKRNEGELGVFGLRGGSVFGEHEVRFLGEHEELSIKHRALSRALFAEGAIVLSQWIQKQGGGRHYSLMDVTL